MMGYAAAMVLLDLERPGRQGVFHQQRQPHAVAADAYGRSEVALSVAWVLSRPRHSLPGRINGELADTAGESGQLSTARFDWL